jgi:polyisoprenoid-binding protein YceI
MNKGLIAVIIAVAVVAVAGLGTYAYLTAPTKGPSTNQMTPPPGGPGMGNRQPPAPLAAADQPTADAVTLTDGQQRYQINGASSTATFTLTEQLRGEPKTVVGTSTGMIAGELAIDRNALASSTVGAIKLNARTFVTDDNSRNNMIRRAILKTEDDANEYITFSPTSLTGLPAKATTGTSFSFDIMGDLTIAGTTKPADFKASATFNADGTLSIHATTTVKRGDFNLIIPNIPFVANVQEDVLLNLDLNASAV